MVKEYCIVSSILYFLIIFNVFHMNLSITILRRKKGGVQSDLCLAIIYLLIDRQKLRNILAKVRIYSVE